MEMKAFLTDAGSAVVTQLLASQGELTVTRAEIGSGIVTSEEAARERTELISKLANANLASCTLSNQQAAIDVQYSNEGQEESSTAMRRSATRRTRSLRGARRCIRGRTGCLCSSAMYRT